MVFSHRMALRFLVLIAVPLVMTGCFNNKQPQDTKAPVIEDKLGIIDMNKTIKAHPRYNEYQALQLQINALNYQLDAKRQLSSPDTANQPSEFQQAEALSGVSANKAIEINSKKAKKQNELQDRFAQKEKQVQENLQNEFKAYKTELDKEYLLPLFNLNIKQKASLSQSEVAALNDDYEKLTKEQQQKLAAKKADLDSRRDQILSAEYESMQAEMQAFLVQLDKEVAAKQADEAPISLTAALPTDIDGESQAKIIEQLSGLQQQQTLLEQQIIEDIQNTAGQIAAQKGLDTILTNIRVNARAIDITDLVIAGLKK